MSLIPNFCILCKDKTNRNIALCTDCENDLPKKEINFDYKPPISYWISLMKFHNKWYYAKMLGQLFAKRLKKSIPKEQYPELIIPVPLHRKRLQKRGFNQAIEIAKPISKLLNIPIDRHSVKRIKATKPQSELTEIQRQKNVKNAFEITKPISAKHIVLIDDVMTTGNTINELKKTLRTSGIKQIDVWTCAQT